MGGGDWAFKSVPGVKPGATRGDARVESRLVVQGTRKKTAGRMAFEAHGKQVRRG
jgi:hypothetical protein